MRASALSGFVRINTTLHAPADGGTKACLRAECIADNQGDKLRYMGDIDSDDNQGEADVGNGHERHHHFREVGDTLDAAEDDKAEQKQGERGSRQTIDADFTGNATIDDSAFTDDLHHGIGHTVGLRAEQENTARNDGGDGEHNAVPLPAEAALEIISGTAKMLPGFRITRLINLRQGGFHISGGRAEKSAKPHPKHGARPTETDSGGNAGDVTDTDTAGERHRHRLKRRNAMLGLPAGFQQQAAHLTEMPHLHEAGHDGIKQPNSQNQPDKSGVPDDTVQPGNGGFKGGSVHTEYLLDDGRDVRQGNLAQNAQISTTMPTKSLGYRCLRPY